LIFKPWLLLGCLFLQKSEEFKKDCPSGCSWGKPFKNLNLFGDQRSARGFSEISELLVKGYLASVDKNTINSSSSLILL
jgi:hypothetical protein